MGSVIRDVYLASLLHIAVSDKCIGTAYHMRRKCSLFIQHLLEAVLLKYLLVTGSDGCTMIEERYTYLKLKFGAK